jgi:hypothetical protein
MRGEIKMNEPKTFEDAVRQIANEIADLVISKQHDYGHGNILKFGEVGIKVRSSDKRERLKNLLGKIEELSESKTMNEPLKDSWKDIAGYAIIALMLDRDQFELELGHKVLPAGPEFPNWKSKCETKSVLKPGEEW